MRKNWTSETKISQYRPWKNKNFAFTYRIEEDGKKWKVESGKMLKYWKMGRWAILRK